MEPSLPQSFFPTLAYQMEDGNIVVGASALLLQVYHIYLYFEKKKI